MVLGCDKFYLGYFLIGLFVGDVYSMRLFGGYYLEEEEGRGFLEEVEIRKGIYMFRWCRLIVRLGVCGLGYFKG